ACRSRCLALAGAFAEDVALSLYSVRMRATFLLTVLLGFCAESPLHPTAIDQAPDPATVVFVVAGQSNAGFWGEGQQRTVTGHVTFFDGTTWTRCHDSIPI